MIEVLEPGFYSSIQDLGRFSMVENGVPIAGNMDAISASRANLLLGNKITEAALEITMTGPRLLFKVHSTICLSGAHFEALLDDKVLGRDTPHEIKAGQKLTIGRANDGFRAYLAVRGGFETPIVYGSRSWYNGLTDQFRLKKRDILDIAESSFESVTNINVHIPEALDLNTNCIDTYQGPEFHLLSEAQKSEILNTEFSVSPNNSRMAYALNEEIENNLASMLTSPVMPGTVQLTPSGKLFILMRDCQTTGGYPRILQLSEKAICILSQKFTGDKIKFKLNNL